MLIRSPPHTLMVDKENYYQKYIVYAKYQIVSTKAVVQVEFPAPSTNKTPLIRNKV